jgi:hypothetical protein
VSHGYKCVLEDIEQALQTGSPVAACSFPPGPLAEYTDYLTRKPNMNSNLHRTQVRFEFVEVLH